MSQHQFVIPSQWEQITDYPCLNMLVDAANEIEYFSEKKRKSLPKADKELTTLRQDWYY